MLLLISLKFLLVYLAFSFARPGDSFEKVSKEIHAGAIEELPEGPLEEFSKIPLGELSETTRAIPLLGDLSVTPGKILVGVSKKPKSILLELPEKTTEEPSPEPTKEVYVLEQRNSIPKRVFCQELGNSCFTLLTADGALGMVYPCCGRHTACDSRTGVCAPGYGTTDGGAAGIYARPVHASG